MRQSSGHLTGLSMYTLICSFLLILFQETISTGWYGSIPQNFEKVTIDGNVAATLLGTAAADTLTGDAGADTITGRGGADTLTGGSRSDKFVFESGDTGITEATADTITDFATGTDKIDIDAPGSYVEADGTSTANFAAFITAADASLTASDVIYAQYNFTGGGNTLVVIDEQKGEPNAGDTLIILTGLSLLVV